MAAIDEMFATWLANPSNSNHPDRQRIQQAHDMRAGRPTIGAGESEEAALAAQVLVSAGLTPAKAAAEPRTEAELAAQIVAAHYSNRH